MEFLLLLAPSVVVVQRSDLPQALLSTVWDRLPSQRITHHAKISILIASDPHIPIEDRLKSKLFSTFLGRHKHGLSAIGSVPSNVVIGDLLPECVKVVLEFNNEFLIKVELADNLDGLGFVFAATGELASTGKRDEFSSFWELGDIGVVHYCLCGF